MTDPTAAPPPDEPQASSAPDPGPSAPSPGAASDPGGHDHHGIIVFFGVLALILLLVGAVGAGLSNGPGGNGSGSDDDGSIGQRRRLEQQERRVERRAAWLERHMARLERRAERLQQRAERRAERERERQQGGQSEDDEDAVMTEATGTVVAQTEADGSTTYVLDTVAGTLVLDVGPERYWAGNNPLIPLVGQTTTVRGLQEPGDDEMEVFAVGDQVIRGQGPPPWAGGGKPGSKSAADPSASPGTSPGPSASP